MIFSALRDKKAFTLLEMVIAMTLTVVALSMSISFISLASKFSSKQRDDALSMTERLYVLSTIDTFVSHHSLPGYTLSLVASDTITVSSEAGDFSLRFDSSSRILTCQFARGETVKRMLSTVREVSFERSGWLVNATISFNSFPTSTYLCDFGVLS